jgi:homoserine dehydrogenase
MSGDRLRVGIAGLGTVGGGVLKLFADPLSGLSRKLELKAVSARTRDRDRGVSLDGLRWYDDPVVLASDPEIDVFVELMGGEGGPAKLAVEGALKRGAHVVTANKALMAMHGSALAELAEANGAKLLFEAAVGGGVPMVRALKESLAACRTQAISGILNGTCNYILSEMEAAGRSFEDVLSEAQRLGYAEADPTTDVGGFDAAHKLTLLAAIAFASRPDFGSVQIEGVERVTLDDITLAGKLGYRVKLVARAERLADGALAMRVRPTLLPLDHPLAGVNGSLNALVVDAEPVGQLTFIGRGAGEGPTAASVAADLLETADGGASTVFGRRFTALADAGRGKPARFGRYYLRLRAADRPGAVAAISDRLAHEAISIESFLQMPVQSGAGVPIVLTTQPCPRSALDKAVEAIAALDVALGAPFVMAIEHSRPGAS